MAAGVAMGEAASGKEAAGSAAWSEPRRLLRSGEPTNTAGHAFGDAITALAAVRAPSAPKSAARLALVVGHRTQGVSVVELAQRAGRWEHVIDSPLNRRWHATTAVALEGSRLSDEGRAHRVQEMGLGLGAVACLRELPWLSVLCSVDGWVVEVTPLAGHAIRRLSLGQVGARALAVRAESGQTVAVYMLGERGHLFRFVSHQRFDGRQLHANLGVLSIGDLQVANLAGGSWDSLTAGLTADAWEARLRDPYSAPLPEPVFAASLASARPRMALDREKGGLLRIQLGAETIELLDLGATFRFTRKTVEGAAALLDAPVSFGLTLPESTGKLEAVAVEGAADAGALLVRDRLR